MRRAARIDDNHREVVEALRQHGCSVLDLASVGKGCPDLLVGYNGVNYLMEVKDGSKPPSRRKLTNDQQVWHCNWTGQAVVVQSAEQAVDYIRERS